MLSFLKRLISPLVAPAPASSPAKILQSAPKASVSFNSTTATAPPEEKPGENTLRYTRLIMVTAENNNKYYEMKENADGTFTVNYGRVGASCVTTSYPVQDWNSKFNEKMRKGYVDHTGMIADSSTDSDFAAIAETEIKKLIDELLACSKQSISRNYNVAANQVTKRQVEKAQELLDQLVQQLRKDMNAADFNARLLELYQVIPRKMKNVREHLVETAATKENLQTIEKQLAEEQATLDVMRGEVEMNERQKEQSPGKALTMLEAFGLQLEQVADKEMIKHIKKMMGDDKDKFCRAFKVTNLRTQPQFDWQVTESKNKSVALFWHGSRNENWLSILKTGLVLRPANAVITGKMFGYGLYFADKCRKSLNYTSLNGSYWAKGSQNKAWLALYDVHLGKPLKIKHHENWCCQLTGEKLREKGTDYDSVFAQGGADLVNNEYIVYDEKQCTVRYFVEIK